MTNRNITRMHCLIHTPCAEFQITMKVLRLCSWRVSEMFLQILLWVYHMFLARSLLWGWDQWIYPTVQAETRLMMFYVLLRAHQQYIRPTVPRSFQLYISEREDSAVGKLPVEGLQDSSVGQIVASQSRRDGRRCRFCPDRSCCVSRHIWSHPQEPVIQVIPDCAHNSTNTVALMIRLRDLTFQLHEQMPRCRANVRKHAAHTHSTTYDFTTSFWGIPNMINVCSYHSTEQSLPPMLLFQCQRRIAVFWNLSTGK